MTIEAKLVSESDKTAMVMKSERENKWSVVNENKIELSDGNPCFLSVMHESKVSERNEVRVVGRADGQGGEVEEAVFGPGVEIVYLNIGLELKTS